MKKVGHILRFQSTNVVSAHRSKVVISRMVSTASQKRGTHKAQKRDSVASQVQFEKHHIAENETVQTRKKSLPQKREIFLSKMGTNTHKVADQNSSSPDASKRRLYFDTLAQTVGIRNLDDWYEKISSKTLEQHSGKGWSCYKGSPATSLMAAYPEHNWIPWKFNNVPDGYWSAIENQRKFFDWLGKELEITSLDDWYEKLSTGIVLQNCGGGLLKTHKNSPMAALITAYPEHNWIPWKFNNVPQGFWSSIENQRKYFDWLGKELQVQRMDDWYQKLSKDIVVKYCGARLLEIYNGSPATALMAAYPEHNWIPWKFNMVPNGFWNSLDNQKKYFDWLRHELQINQMDDWYQKLSKDTFLEYCGAGLLAIHKGSPPSALMAAYPEHNWIPWKFNHVPDGFWKSTDHFREYFDWLGTELGIEHLDDWYENLSHATIRQKDGAGLLNAFKGSPTIALMAAYPEHNWVPEKFKCTPHSFWRFSDNVSKFLAELSEKLSIQTLDDWYRVDLKQLELFGATTLVNRYKGLYNILKEQYPHHPWDRKRFKQIGKKGQRWLAVTLKKMFPNEEILEDYMHPKVLLSSNRPMQLDVFIPSRSLAFEYQGQQHYEDVSLFIPAKANQQRDEEKRILCAANNIKLIEVPYWWNRTQESLQEIISK